MDKTLFIKELLDLKGESDSGINAIILIDDSYLELPMAAQKAIGQMLEKHYGEELIRDGYTSAICFGMAFYKKNCVVMAREHKFHKIS